MRAILAFVVAAGMLLLSFGIVVPDGQPVHVGLRWAIGVFAVILILAGMSHLRLLYRRRQAYSNGRQKRGKVRLYRPIERGSEDITAIITFATDRAEWIMTLDLSSIKGLEEVLAEGLDARAWLGDDNHIYGLDIGKQRTLPISAGIPLDRKMKEKLDRAEQRMARVAERQKA